jgi:predicted transcriptional regulator
MFQNNTEDVAKQKLLLLYILKVSPDFLTKEKLSEILIDNFNMNFFIIQQYISELSAGGFISLDNDESNPVLVLEDGGSETLDYFKSKMTDSMISEVHRIFNLNSSGKPIPIQAEATSYPRDNGEINVNLKLVEMEETVFSLYLSVPNQEQATVLMEKWEKSPDYYYKSIIELFIDNKPTI